LILLGELVVARFGLGPGWPLTVPAHVVDGVGFDSGALGDLYALPLGSSLKKALK
jgi:hypothetical protein